MSDLINYLGKKVLNFKEKFQDSNPPVVTGTVPVAFAGTAALLFILFWIVFGILTAYGAAKLSYCYNKHIGSDDGTAFLFSILCFCFSGFYYPYYGVFLNPLCSLSKITGGRRR